MDHHQAHAQRAQQGEVVNQAREIVIDYRLAAKRNDESTAAEGVDVR